ncbi:PucR family transcriptional regulator [Actinoallomurus sp. CA-150999]|uniref:PucR family transcriptional regulator n=1 Tax=Actinoallomurus sp. CA-150999 TaxID=3239887 RepID=UPI003D9042C1
MVEDEETERLLRTVGERLMACRDELVDVVTEQIVTAVPTYARFVPGEDLVASGRNVLDIVLGVLGGQGVSEKAMAGAVGAGRRRLRQGMPLEDVLRAIRMDFVVLWDALVVEAARIDRSTLVISAGAPLVWAALDEAMAATTQGYRHEETTLDRERAARRAKAFTALASSTAPSDSLVADAAEALGLPLDLRLLVVAAHLPEDVASRLEMQWRAVNAATHVGFLGFDMVGVTVWSRQARKALDHLVSGHADRVAVVAPETPSLRDLPSTVGLARAALLGAPGGVVHEARDLVIETVLSGQMDAARSLAREVLGPLLNGSPAERTRLLETLQGWLETDGTTGQVARHLYRHRNTVINHLRRVEELSGLSLTRPRDVATLVLALKMID